ncbi:PTS sugar transporter subunit IIA [Vibrio sp. MEBiC08052]|uniref:PTS sugar transporter subunit IIA n=1 Tax=Vibrio sp. MEBiC08052 TaxID=1761910 RepID=UPI0007406FAC|nr:fructose PTS transporter subunit IIA [Vibrio sp. MEBiC08052]KUI97370.1 PTS IIA-like nitrogen-regulatory protein PtsN [Vibrio sp. MEBiC08052]
MDISSVLKAQHIKLNMSARTKQEAIEELIDLLVQDGCVSDKAQFLRDVWQREAQGTTGFENHIALPHGTSSAVSQTALAIGRTPQGIDWQVKDGSDIRCIILYAICSDAHNTTHVRLLTQVSYALADEDIITQLLAENEPQNIIAMLNQPS